MLNETDGQLSKEIDPLSTINVVIQQFIPEERTTKNFTDMLFVPSLTMDNLSSQGIGFLDTTSSPQIFNGYTAEQLFGTTSIPAPNFEANIQPSIPDEDVNISFTDIYFLSPTSPVSPYYG